VGLDELRKGMLEKAREEARALAREAEAEASSLTNKAKEQRSEILANAKREAKELIDAERNEAIANAHLEAKRELAKAKGELVDSVEKKVWSELLKVRSKKSSYSKLLHKLIDQGKRMLEGGTPIVYVRAEDRKLLKDLKGARLADKSIDCSGGAIITSADGRVRIDNTLEALFEEKQDAMRIEIRNAVLKK